MPPRGQFAHIAQLLFVPCSASVMRFRQPRSPRVGRSPAHFLMSAFGLGTIVSLSVVSVLLHSLGIARIPRQASGALLILFAIWTVLPLLQAPTQGH